MEMTQGAWDSLLVLSFFLINGDDASKAVKILEGMHRINDQDAQVHKLMAYGYFQLKDAQSCLFHIDESYKLQSSDEKIYGLEILRARALYLAGEAEKSIETLERINRK